MSAEVSYVKRLEGICATAVAEKMEARVSHRTYQYLNFTEKSNASKETREGTWRRVAKLRHSVCLKNIFSTLTDTPDRKPVQTGHEKERERNSDLPWSNRDSKIEHNEAATKRWRTPIMILLWQRKEWFNIQYSVGYLQCIWVIRMNQWKVDRFVCLLGCAMGRWKIWYVAFMVSI